MIHEGSHCQRRVPKRYTLLALGLAMGCGQLTLGFLLRALNPRSRPNDLAVPRACGRFSGPDDKWQAALDLDLFHAVLDGERDTVKELLALGFSEKVLYFFVRSLRVIRVG
ncbi:unnamed protein product [Durusdinium trenchii]|uniref:Uncharacterized protein n=1 Tax=Durusdinium trenchii TaxID=1381693 RepID=A0ABP0SLI8_9DINO